MAAPDSGTSAGHYQRQASGYRAFMPAALPPTPPIRLEGALQGLLSQADRALGRLDGSIQTLPHPDLFVAMYVRKEAVLSSQIEGTQSSLQDVLAAEARMLSADRPQDVDEVFNYVHAMNHGLGRLTTLPVSVSFTRLTRASRAPLSFSTSPIFSIGARVLVMAEAVLPILLARSILDRVCRGAAMRLSSTMYSDRPMP